MTSSTARPARSYAQQRETVAAACRILARRGALEGVLGHVSTRVQDGMLIRARRSEESGLLFSEADDILHCGLDGNPVEPAEDCRVPSEHPLHGAAYRLREDVNWVVHAHPTAAMCADLAGLELRPVFGAYNIPAARMAAEGIPVFEHPWLIDSASLAAEVVATMGEASVCLMRGHGVLVVGETAAQAVMRTLNIDALARISLCIARAGGKPRALTGSDLERLPDLGAAFNDELGWRHQLRIDSIERKRAT